MKKTSQISVEYMMIIAISLMIIIPGALLFRNFGSYLILISLLFHYYLIFKIKFSIFEKRTKKERKKKEKRTKKERKFHYYLEKSVLIWFLFERKITKISLLFRKFDSFLILFWFFFGSFFILF